MREQLNVFSSKQAAIFSQTMVLSEEVYFQRLEVINRKPNSECIHIYVVLIDLPTLKQTT